MVIMASLILAGESIYMLQYSLRREFQTSMLETMELTNTELGTLSSMFGVLALVSYFFGGWLADRLSIRKLLSVSLVATGVGGLYMATYPGYLELIALYAFWGVFSILTFWAALIKATRAWGGERSQGRAFGILDGGRGVVSAGLASLGIVLFARFDHVEAGLRSVILLYSCTNFVAAVMTWFVIQDDPLGTRRRAPPGFPTLTQAGSGVRELAARFAGVLRIPSVWVLSPIIFCAYMGYWGTFDFSAFAVDGWGQTQVFGATVSTFGVWLRPVAAIAAGFFADRAQASTAVIVCFTSLVAAFSLFALVPTEQGFLVLLWANTAAIAAAVFALRGIYYALLEEGAVPMALTGTAVGVVSVIGYSPDTFIPLLSGWLIDTYPGAQGHQYFFGILAGASLVGLGASVVLRAVVHRAPRLPPNAEWA